eukprot:a180614_9.p1 GENE.a180614_9~~a180614_9.p1  ORF type:complete len:190 (-),score=25.55 a180614_9:153-680(-)
MANTAPPEPHGLGSYSLSVALPAPLALDFDEIRRMAAVLRADLLGQVVASSVSGPETEKELKASLLVLGFTEDQVTSAVEVAKCSTIEDATDYVLGRRARDRGALVSPLDAYAGVPANSAAAPGMPAAPGSPGAALMTRESLMSMGVDATVVDSVLQATGGNVQMAFDLLFGNGA